MKSVWYYNQNLKPQGPLSLVEIKGRIQKGEIGPFELLYNEQEQQWRPAREWGVFPESLFPAGQVVSTVVEELSQVENLMEWVLLRKLEEGRVTQEGPYSLRQIREGLQKKEISLDQYIWKTGMTGWCRIQDRPEFM
ncbi:MAG: DUF4339 domain-containing protein [Bdellovibrio sp.]